MRGRKPTPSAVLAARSASELTFVEPMMPEKPRALSAGAAETWEKLGPQLVALGVLTPLDAHPFATYCETLERYKACQAAVDADGLTVTTPQGFTAHPLLTEMRACLRTLRDFENDFGMRHLARSRIAIAPATERKPDAFDEFLAELPALPPAETPGDPPEA